MSKNKKKEKPYYKVNNKQQEEKSNNKDLTKNTTFMLGIGFLIMFYSRYINAAIYSRILAIFGLVLMLYGIYNSSKTNKQKDGKFSLYIDYVMAFLVVAGIIYNIYILFKTM